MANVLKILPPAMSGPLYGLIRSVIAAGSIGAIDDMRSVAGKIGRSFADLRFNRKRLARAVENLRQAFPDKPDRWHHDRAVDAYEHLMMLGIEMAYAGRMLSPHAWTKHLRLDGIEPIIGAMTSGRPIIFVSGHCGNWEVSGYALGILGLKLHALYRPMDLVPLDKWLRRSRARSGLVLVDKFGASEQMPRIMQEGHPLGVVADQNAGVKGQFVPFFGKLASTYKAIGILAVQSQAQVIVGVAHRDLSDPLREPDTLGYIMRAYESFGPEDYMSQPDPAFYVTARYRRGIERSIREHPEQCLWMHRYWRSRPKWEMQGKAMPGAFRKKLEQLPWMTEQEMSRLLAADAAAVAESR